ncbi:MAG: hypothetical protein ACK55Z_10080, partial [bacterium]
ARPSRRLPAACLPAVMMTRAPHPDHCLRRGLRGLDTTRLRGEATAPVPCLALPCPAPPTTSRTAATAIHYPFRATKLLKL